MSVGVKPVKVDVHAVDFVDNGSDVMPRLAELDFMDVYVENVKVVAISDSGAEVNIVRRSVLPEILFSMVAFR